MVRVGMMPPPGMPRPKAETVATFLNTLETSVDQASQAHLNPGRPALHRLNRTEYANSIRDLLAVDVDVTAMLPPDDMSHGFDNMADVLTVSKAGADGKAIFAPPGESAGRAIGDATRTGAHAELPDFARAEPDAAHRRHSVRNPRRHRGDARFSGGRRIHLQGRFLLLAHRSLVRIESGQRPADRNRGERRSGGADRDQSVHDAGQGWDRRRTRSRSRPARNGFRLPSS